MKILFWIAFGIVLFGVIFHDKLSYKKAYYRWKKETEKGEEYENLYLH